MNRSKTQQAGKLPISYPHRTEDNPTFFNYRSEQGRVLYGEDVYVDYRFYEKIRRPPLFPFGYGLSYTRFDLSKIAIDVRDPIIALTLSVSNTGTRAGAEVVQVYVSACAPSIGRPPKELKGFKKVFLEQGEEKRVEVELDTKLATSFWDEGRHSWVAEKGTYRVLVGNSSLCENFLEASFEIEETFWWNGL